MRFEFAFFSQRPQSYLLYDHLFCYMFVKYQTTPLFWIIFKDFISSGQYQSFLYVHFVISMFIVLNIVFQKKYPLLMFDLHVFLILYSVLFQLKKWSKSDQKMAKTHLHLHQPNRVHDCHPKIRMIENTSGNLHIRPKWFDPIEFQHYFCNWPRSNDSKRHQIINWLHRILVG